MEFVTDLSLGSRFLRGCDIPVPPRRTDPFTLVIYGGAGDLTRRKLMPTLLGLFVQGELPALFRVLGVGLPALADEQWRGLMAGACRDNPGSSFSEEAWARFAPALSYVGGGFDDPGLYDRLLARVAGVPEACGRHLVHYLAVPPDAAPLIVANLRRVRLCEGSLGAKVVVEKPFGRDRASASALNAVLREAFDEERIYRIDHYLGKETVQNIIFFRFSNTIFEQLWNSRYVDHVQITVAEDLGVAHRAAFYERSGVVRDIVQNHMLQLLALVAMEPPIGFEAEFIRDEKVKVFRSIRPLDAAGVGAAVRGQYGPGEVGGEPARGYREEEGVAADSPVPTFVAARLAVANWRWAGVPFYLRTGKRLSRRVTEIVVQFRQPPLRLFGRSCDVLEPNLLTLAIQPEEGIRLRFGIKAPGSDNQIAAVTTRLNYYESYAGGPREPYGKLLLDCLRGDVTLFERQDGVEAMWDVVDPLVEHWERNRPPDFPNYAAGSWGPAAADELLAGDGRRWLTR